MAQPGTDGDLGTILGIFAHPDDEAYLAGALMATAVDAGRRVVCVTAAGGSFGFADDDPRSIEERMAVRESELAAVRQSWRGGPSLARLRRRRLRPSTTVRRPTAWPIDDVRPTRC
jgi:hypothetical protein